MPKVRIVGATRHKKGNEDALRTNVLFLTDTDKEIGRLTVDTSIEGGLPELKDAVLAEWEVLQDTTIQGLVGQEYEL